MKCKIHIKLINGEEINWTGHTDDLIMGTEYFHYKTNQVAFDSIKNLNIEMI